MIVQTEPKATAPTSKGADGENLIVVPFTRGTRERTDGFHDRTTALGANSTQVGPEDVVARGWMRHVLLFVEFSGGAAGAAATAASEDAPWNVLSSIELQDVNGNPLVQLDGYNLFLANKYGGYAGQADPRKSPAFSALDADGNGSFVLRVPVEISARDGLGALKNQNAAQTYKIAYTVAPAASVFTTAPATLPNVRVRAVLESWSKPKATDVFGNPVAQTPPADGTMQFLSRYVVNIDAGQQTIRLPRVGNHIRNIIGVFRAGGVRSTANLPDQLQFTYDGNIVDSLPRELIRHRIAERYQLDGADDGAGGLDSGVIGFDFAHDLDGIVGHEMRDGYLATHQGTDLELSGAFGAAGQLQIITNDVAAAGGIYAA